MKRALMASEVDELLVTALPEFADNVRQHRAEWPDDPMLYILIGSLFDLAVSAARESHNGMSLARRIYQVVERALSDGEKSVQDCFAIEMIEPLAGDPKHEYYPNLETVMGPVALDELRGWRQWGTRYRAIMAAVSDVNRNIGFPLFRAAGLTGDDARVIAVRELWDRVAASDRESAAQSLAASWRSICSPADASIEITDETFNVLFRA